MGLLAMLRRHRRAIMVPVATWLLLQVVMAAGVRAGTGMLPGEAGAEARLLRDLATVICLAGQPADDGREQPSLHDRCSWCAAFGQSALPAVPAVLLAASVPPLYAAQPALRMPAPRLPPRFTLFLTRAPPI